MTRTPSNPTTPTTPTLDYAPSRPAPGRSLVTLAARPETVAALLLLLAMLVGATLSPYFLDAEYLLGSTSLYMEIGVMALAMTFVIISGNIDLSVASNLALTGVLCGRLYADWEVPMPIAAALAPVVGALLGLFNGVLISGLKLPSLTVTLGTLALYRGLAQVLAGDYSIGGFPEWFVGVNYRYVGPLPLPLVIFLGLAVAFGLVLHVTTFGRAVYVLGLNEPAARFAGVRVDWVKLAVFTLSGAMAGLGAAMMTSRLSVARYDLALGDELAVITAVVLGGTDIFGGRGSILGTVIALFLLGVIREGMRLANITADYQLAVTGTLLIAAVLLARLAGQVQGRLHSRQQLQNA